MFIIIVLLLVLSWVKKRWSYIYREQYLDIKNFPLKQGTVGFDSGRYPTNVCGLQKSSTLYTFKKDAFGSILVTKTYLNNSFIPLFILPVNIMARCQIVE